MRWMLALVLLASNAWADCLPKLALPKAWTACTKDSDCVLAGDGCRTCINWLPVNKRHQAAATKKDAEARAKAQCVMTCEACAASAVVVRCEAKQCTASGAQDGGAADGR
ncbi:MAG: hypothetical protein AB1938_25015 [Myxococcota bacterium]